MRDVERTRYNSGVQFEKVRPQLPAVLSALQSPQLPHSELPVALRLPRIGVRDLGFYHEIGGGTLEEGVSLGISFPERREIASESVGFEIRRG